MTRLTSYGLSYRETDPEFNIEGVVPPALFARFGTQRFAPLSALKDALRDVNSDRKGGKRGGACRAGTATNTCSPKELLP
jgi:hypothetical protein